MESGPNSRNCEQTLPESDPQNAYGIVRHSTLWLKPKLVGQFDFAEWTPENHLRHSRFVGLREDKETHEVRKDI
jgi:ATP-dependent DNA ligase